MTDPLPEDQRLKDISPKAYEHPADRAATAALQSIPMLDVVVRKLIEFGYERALRQIFLAGSVKLGPEQLPELWAAAPRRLRAARPPEVPDLYLTQFPITNAAAIGAGRPIVLVNSRTVELLDEEELRTVLGHEAGHILSDHVMYRTALMILLSIGFRAAADDGRAAAAGGQARAARVVPRRRAELRPRGHARQPRSARHLPHADGAGRRRQVEEAEPRRVPQAGRASTRSGSPAGTGSSRLRTELGADPRGAGPARVASS